MTNELIESAIKNYEKDLKQLNKVFNVVKRINNASVKVLFESVIIEKTIFLSNLIKKLKEVNHNIKGEPSK